jgi:hypothetical protein
MALVGIVGVGDGRANSLLGRPHIAMLKLPEHPIHPFLEAPSHHDVGQYSLRPRRKAADRNADHHTGAESNLHLHQHDAGRARRREGLWQASVTDEDNHILPNIPKQRAVLSRSRHGNHPLGRSLEQGAGSTRPISLAESPNSEEGRLAGKVRYTPALAHQERPKDESSP